LKKRSKSYEKKNPTTIFIQLLKKTIKNKIKNIYSEKKHWKKKYYLNVVAGEAKKR
jgi:hypothetical protein